MSFYDLPDRQVVYLLAYLRDALRADQHAKQWLKTSDAIVDHTLARHFQAIKLYKGEVAFEIHAAGLPYLALYREKLANKQKGEYRTHAQMTLGWVCRLPGPSAEFDPWAWGITLASNMWHVTREKLCDIPADTLSKSAIEEIELGPVEILIGNQENVCGFEASITVIHLKPPYEIEDMDDLQRTILEIKLYDSSQVGPDGIQGLDLGLSVGSQIDAE